MKIMTVHLYISQDWHGTLSPNHRGIGMSAIPKNEKKFKKTKKRRKGQDRRVNKDRKESIDRCCYPSPRLQYVFWGSYKRTQIAAKF